MSKLNLHEFGVAELSAKDLSLIEGGSWFSNYVSYGAGWIAGKIVNGAEAVGRGLAAWSGAMASADPQSIHSY